MDVVLIIGCIIYPPTGFGLIATVPVTFVAGYYFWTPSNGNEKPDLKVGNGNNKPSFSDPNRKKEHNLKREEPDINNEDQNKSNTFPKIK